MAAGLTKEMLKEAVYKAIRLVRTTEQATLNHAEWLQEFGTTNKFSLVGFVKYFSEKHSLSDESKTLLRNSLRESLFMKDRNSSPQRKANIKSPSSEAQPQSIEAETFLALIKLLFSKIENHGVSHGDLISSLSDSLHQTNIVLNSQSQFLGWCLRQSGEGIQRIVTVDEMSAVIHSFYNAICETLGPVEADSILGSAVDTIKTHPCGLKFSPDSFL